MRGIECYLFDCPGTCMFGWSNNEEGFDIMLGVFGIVLLKGR